VLLFWRLISSLTRGMWLSAWFLLQISMQIRVQNRRINTVVAVGDIYTHRRSTNPDEWENFSNRNIAEADRQSQNSAALRVIVDGVLQTSCNDMRRQKEATDFALARRIDETRDAKEKLEAHLAKVLHATNMHTCINKRSAACSYLSFTCFSSVHWCNVDVYFHF